MPAERSILHVDMDAFFASVEQLDHPAWRGRPVLVGYDGPRGVVAAASYESRVFGCHSAQPMSVAKRLCPSAIIAPVRFERYREVSRRIFAIFERYTPLIEPLSIDEAFLDVTASERIFGSPLTMARDLKARVRGETALTASIGVAGNKFLAKLASDLEKPDGLTVIGPADVDRILMPLSVSKIWGIGPKTATRLEGFGIRTIADLRRVPSDVLAKRIGDDGAHYQRLALGLDDRPVHTDREAKSIGQEQTFGVNVADADLIHQVMAEQAQQVAARLRRHGLRAAAVTIKIRYGDFKTITRSTTLDAPSDITTAIAQAARNLFDHWAARDFKPVRLIGVTATRLSAGAGQLELFADPGSEKQRRIDQTMDRIHSRFGNAAIGRAGGKGRDTPPPLDSGFRINQ